MLNKMTPDAISEDVDRSIKVLDRLQEVVTRLSANLHVIESRLRASGLDLSEAEIPDSVRGVVLIAGPVSDHSPLLHSVNKAKAKHRDSLAFVEVGDFAESQSTCERVRSIIEVRLKKRMRQDAWLVSLRCADASPFLEDKKTLIVGDRFRRDRTNRLNLFVTRMTKIGYRVSEDNGLYGGGPLMYSLLNAGSLNEVEFLTEMTLSEDMAKRTESVSAVIESLSSL